MIFEIKGVKFAIEDKLVHKLDMMIERVMKPHPTLDSCIENSGLEGEGKTNVSIIEAAYIQMKTGRTINMFIRTSTAAKFMQENNQGLVILDEPSFETLSMDFASAQSKDLLRLTSTMRVRRHFLIVNFAKFWKFPEFLVVDRALGMVHLHSKNGKEPGRFIYVKKKNLENLWNDYFKKRQRNFGKYRSFGGGFSYKMEELFPVLDITVEGKPHATFQDYQEAKDKAISAIGNKKLKKDKNFMKLLELRSKISKIKDMPRERLAFLLGINSGRLREWDKIDLENPEEDSEEPVKAEIKPESLGKVGFELSSSSSSIITMEKGRQNDEKVLEDEWVEPENDEEEL